MKKQFVRGGMSTKDREFRKRGLFLSMVFGFLFLAGLMMSGCFGERVADRQAADSSYLAPGILSSDIRQDNVTEKRIDPIAFVKLRGQIVDRTGTVLCLSKGKARRFQPYGELFRTIIGYVDEYGRGLDGLEYVYDSFLQKGMDGDGESAPLVLSLDKNLQVEAMKRLEWQARRLGANSGTIVLIDIRSGQVLAMANRILDGQDGAIDKIGHEYSGVNLALKREIHPWPVVYAASIRQYLIDYYSESGDKAKEASVDGGLQVEKWHWIDIGDSGIWTRVTDDLFSAMRVPDDILSILVALGFGQETGIDLPDELQGSLPFSMADNMTKLVDDTIKATPVQTLYAFSRLITGNMSLSPRMTFAHDSSSITVREGGEAVDNAVSSSEDILRGLREIFGDDSGPSIASFTARRVDNKLRYEVVGLGFWPKKSPRIGYITVLFDAKKTPEQRRGTIGKVVGLAKKGASVLDSVFALENVTHDNHTHTDMAKAGNRMPNLVGFSMRSALEAISHMGLVPKVSGRGKVRKQYPRPGQDISNCKECVIICES